MMGGQPVIVLREGTKREQGEPALILNIDAGKAIADAVRTTLGPKGMDKMLVDGQGDTIITNDGVTILKELDVEHPAAKMVIEAAKTQDDECGDGTTTTVILAGELLDKAKGLIKDGIHPTVIVEGYQLAMKEAIRSLRGCGVSVKKNGIRETLFDVAQTSMTGKSTEEHKGALADLVVDCITKIATDKAGIKDTVDVDNVVVVKAKGRGVDETERINGYVFPKEKALKGMKLAVEERENGYNNIALFSGSLIVKDHDVNISEIEELDKLVKRDEKELIDMIDLITSKHIDILFVQKGISDEAASMLEARGIIAYERVSEDEMDVISKLTGAHIAGKLEDLDRAYVKYQTNKHEGQDHVYLVYEAKGSKVQTVIVRGATDHIVDEIGRSIHDALSTVAVAYEYAVVNIGGGSSFMEMVIALSTYADKMDGRKSFAVKAFSEACESIPRTLAENGGLDKIDTLLKLKKAHTEGKKFHGINIENGTVEDMRPLHVYEPYRLVEQTLIGAVGTASMILRIDDVIASKGMDLGPSAPGAPPGAPPGA